MKTAVIFDMDGVLVQSEPVILEAAIKGLREYGIDPRPEDFKPFIGTGENMFIGGVAEKYGIKFVPEMKKRVYDIYDEIVGDKIEIVPGVNELLEYLSGKKVKMAIASSADERKIRSNLLAAKIPEKYFTAILSGEDVDKRKPFPDIYLEAARLIGERPVDCIVIEDAINGIQAAKAAGMDCIALTTSFDEETLKREEPLKVFCDLTKIRDYFKKNWRDLEYESYTKKQLIDKINELEILNSELLREQQEETTLDFAWSGNLGHWYWNIKTNTVIFNPMKVMALGYTRDEIPEKTDYQYFTDMLHPDDYEKTMQSMRDHMHGISKVYEIEYRMKAKDGSWRWYHDRGKITKRDENGDPLFMSGIVFDITNKKRNELILEKENIKLKIESGTDALTGIHNRRAVIEKLIDEMSIASRSKRPLTIAMIDLDHFKLINDSKGHVFGDRVLKRIALLISESLREFDAVGRYGGEEFLAVLPGTSIKNAHTVAQRIRSCIEEHIFEDGSKVTVSIGLKEFEDESVEELIDRADMKLYLAKNSGRNRVEG